VHLLKVYSEPDRLLIAQAGLLTYSLHLAPSHSIEQWRVASALTEFTAAETVQALHLIPFYCGGRMVTTNPCGAKVMIIHLAG